MMGPPGPLALEPRTIQAEVRPFIPSPCRTIRTYRPLRRISSWLTEHHLLALNWSATYTVEPRDLADGKPVALPVYRPRAWGSRGGGGKLMRLEESPLSKPSVPHEYVTPVSYNTPFPITQCSPTHNKVSIRQVTLIQIRSSLLATVYLKRDNYHCWVEPEIQPR